MPDTTEEERAKPKAPKGTQVEARMVNTPSRIGFGFIYLDAGPRIGWSTVKEGGNVELWIGNWGEPNAAGIRLAGMAADYLCDALPWDCTWGWKVDA